MSEGTARNLVMKKVDPFTGEYRRTPGFVECSACGFHGMVYEEDWWSGELLQTYGPHSPGLYEYGYWLVTDRDGHEMIREGM